MRKWSVLAAAGALVLAVVGGASSAWADDPSPSPTPSTTSSPGGSISGHVTVVDGSSPEGAQVIADIRDPQWGSWMWQQQAIVAADGSYTLAGLPDGDYRIDFRSGGTSSSLIEQWWQNAADLWSATTVAVANGTAVTGIDVSMAVGASISGTVHRESGAASMNGMVSASDPATGMTAGSAWTDMDGNYRLNGLKPGSYIVQFSPGYMDGNVATQWWKDASSRESATPVTVGARQELSGIDAVLHPAGMISGTVTDSSGAPATGVYLGIYDASTDGSSGWVTSAMLDASGSFSVSGLAAGSYKIQFSSYGPLLGEWYNHATDIASAAAIAVSPGGTTTVNTSLQRGASVSGVVTDQAGQPVSNALVLVHPTNGVGYTFSAMTAPDGGYSIAGLVPGSYKVEFQTDQATPNVAPSWWSGAKTEAGATTLTLQAAQDATGISPRLTPGGAITGTLRDDKGAPLADALVAVYDTTGTWVQNTLTAADGTYRAHGLAAGRYRIQFTEYIPDGSSLYEWWNNASTLATARQINVPAGKTVSGTDATLALSDHSVRETRTSSISGVVTDALGNPLAGVNVEAHSDQGGDVASTDANGAYSIRYLAAGSYTVSFSGAVGGQQTEQWWDDAATRESSTPVVLQDAQQRTGVNAVLGAGALPPLRASQPNVTGTAAVGSLLKAHVRGWTAGTAFAYQWLADGVVVPGETRETLAVTPDLVGKKLTVSVTGSLPGYQDIVQVSAPTAAVRAG